MFPKNRNLGSRAVFSNWALIDLIFGWSGATPERTRPHGVGSISSMSTATSRPPRDWSPDSRFWSAAFSRAAAAKYPEGPAPTIATWYGRSWAICGIEVVLSVGARTHAGGCRDAEGRNSNLQEPVTGAWAVP